MNRLYDQREVSRLLGISENQVRYWDRIRLVPRTDRKAGRLLFDFQGLVALRTVKELINQGISLQRIRKCSERLQHMMPEFSRSRQPLAEIRVFAYRDEIILCKENLRFTPDGQFLIDFTEEKGSLIALPADKTEQLFFQALICEEEGNWEEAKERYEKILNRKPDHVNALVNMGNMRYRLGEVERAEDDYRKALRINPDHVEVNYNLANLFEEKGNLKDAVLFYQKALHEDPGFADAHFNLARALEKAGDTEGAREHWKRYLDLDPSGEWADIIRARLVNP